ncbi:MAG TPA: hypothetical protein VHA37_08115 [Candidatus Saccharimonadales bacterium]|nr:hypothetical protein [Candidatus Saccharimonadales bacterium]
MFGRGTWAIFGLGKESLETFRTTLEDRPAMVAASQMAASAITRYSNTDTIGINPFGGPRLDEEHPVGQDHEPELAGYAASEPEERATLSLPAEISDCQGYGVTEAQFRLHPTMPWYGLWAVSNEWKDVSDVASIKEQRSYRLLDRPYRFLQATDKKSVEQDALGLTAVVRKQVPVLLDFNDGRVYIENTNKKLIWAIAVRLRLLGIEIVPVAWNYPRSDWPAEILSRLYENTQYQRDFQKRAEEATRFKANEIEKLEDRELESIVANFFSMTQLPSDLWIGISGPAQIRLHDASPPLAVRAPTSATTLLNMTEDAKVISGAITFQEFVSATTKKGEEYTFRKNLLCMDLNDRINITDIGAAMMRGFDIPAFRKDVLREIRHTREVPSIEQFWGNWLHEMSNAVRMMEATFRELLDIDGNQEAGILPMQVAASEPAQEVVNA